MSGDKFWKRWVNGNKHGETLDLNSEFIEKNFKTPLSMITVEKTFFCLELASLVVESENYLGSRLLPSFSTLKKGSQEISTTNICFYSCSRYVYTALTFLVSQICAFCRSIPPPK